MRENSGAVKHDERWEEGVGGLRHPPKADTKILHLKTFHVIMTNFDNLKKNIIIGRGAQVMMQNYQINQI